MAKDVDFYEDTVLFFEIFTAIFVIDWLMILLNWFPNPKSNNRYMSIHVIVNAYVVYLTFWDVVETMRDPVEAAIKPTNTSSIIVILALHLYHIAFFRPLPFVDWLHHFVMIIVMSPVAYALMPGLLLGHGAFYASGLPGGIDYLMLVMVKKGWMQSMTEKKYNCFIQLWIRAPGCIIHSVLTYVSQVEVYKMIEKGELPSKGGNMMPLIPLNYIWLGSFVVWFTMYWNGLYFLDRVIRSHERNVVMQDIKEK